MHARVRADALWERAACTVREGGGWVVVKAGVTVVVCGEYVCVCVWTRAEVVTVAAGDGGVAAREVGGTLRRYAGGGNGDGGGGDDAATTAAELVVAASAAVRASAATVAAACTILLARSAKLQPNSTVPGLCACQARAGVG